jgi:hypothetical protein
VTNTAAGIVTNGYIELRANTTNAANWYRAGVAIP